MTAAACERNCAMEVGSGDQPQRYERSSLSCSYCRKRKIKCVTSSGLSGQCDRCLKHAQDCVYVEHQRGRKLGTRNKPAPFARRPPRIAPALRATRGNSSESSSAGQKLSSPPRSASSFSIPSASMSSSTWSTPQATRDAMNWSQHSLLLDAVGETTTATATSAEAGPSTHPTYLRFQPAVDHSTFDFIPKRIPVSPGLRPASRHAESPLGVIRTLQAESGSMPSALGSQRHHAFHDSPLTPRSTWDVGEADIIALGMCDEKEVTLMMSEFHSHIAHYTPFITPRIHTVSFLRVRSPFLLTVMLLVAARHSPRAALAGALQRHIETRLWPRILLNNYRSVWVVQACLLWAAYAPQPAVGEDELSWTVFSHAIRIAIDVGLNTPGLPSADPELAIELSRRNDERTWFLCLVADHSWALQTGREPALQEDERVRHLGRWMLEPGTVDEDDSIAALVQFHRIMAHSESPTPSKSMSTSVEELDRWRDRWLTEDRRASTWLRPLGRLYYHYAHVALRLQHLGLGANEDEPLQTIRQAVEHASRLVHHAANLMPPNAYLYVPNEAFTMMTCGAAVTLRYERFLADMSVRNQIIDDLSMMLCRLGSAIETHPHNNGVDQWHAGLLARVIAQWQQQQFSAEYENMLSAMFPSMVDEDATDSQQVESATMTPSERDGCDRDQARPYSAAGSVAGVTAGPGRSDPGPGSGTGEMGLGSWLALPHTGLWTGTQMSPSGA